MVLVMPALFLAALFIVFANMFSVVYLDDALHGAPLRTLLACLGINGCGGLIIYGAVAYSGLSLVPAYLLGSCAVVIAIALFWLWWFGNKSWSFKMAKYTSFALLLALGTFYGLREYTHILHH